MSRINASASATGLAFWSQFSTRAIQKLQESKLNENWSIKPGRVSNSSCVVFIENKTAGMLFHIVSWPETPDKAVVTLLPLNSKVYIRTYLTKKGYSADLVNPYGATTPELVSVKDTVDPVVKIITNSMYACAIPVAEESIGSHENCGRCSNQLHCLAREEA